MRNVRIYREHGYVKYGQNTEANKFSLNYFGVSEHILIPYLSKKLGDDFTNGRVLLSEGPAEGFTEVRMRLVDAGSEKEFVVTAPKAIRRSRFCVKGVSKYVPGASAAKSLKLYFKVVKK